MAKAAALAFGLVAFLGACNAGRYPAGRIVDKPGLSDAQVIVWRDVYGRTDASPLVFLVESLLCTEPVTGHAGFECPTAGCREGCTGSPLAVHVAYTGQRWSETTLAHEDMHALKMRVAIEALKYTPVGAVLQAIGDRDHGGPEWQPGQAVDKAEQRLREMGL